MNLTTTSAPTGTAPGPKNSFPLGNLRAFRADPLQFVYQCAGKYGDLAGVDMGPRTLFIASHPELAQEVLVNQRETYIKMQRPDGKPVGLQLILGNGLVTNTDPASWLVQRRMMQPMFHRREIAAMGGKIQAAGQRLLANWQTAPRAGEPINVAQEMMQVTLDIITSTMFSANVLAQASEVGPAVSTAAHFTFGRETNPFSLPLSWPTPANRRFAQAREYLDGLIYRLIEERRTSGQQFGDLLDMLLAAQDEETGRGMSDQQLRDEVITIFAAGHETTSNALSWTWHLLAQHPHVRQRLQKELDDVLGGRTPGVEDLAALPYTQAVLEESLRICPPVPAVPRQAAHDTALAGFPIPAGSRIIISIYNIHRHPACWPDPDTFNPERFLPGHAERPHRLAFMPFGAGPRLCIGNHLAMIEGTLLLAMIAQKYELEPVPGHPVVPEVAITLRPKYGLLMTRRARGAH